MTLLLDLPMGVEFVVEPELDPNFSSILPPPGVFERQGPLQIVNVDTGEQFVIRGGQAFGAISQQSIEIYLTSEVATSRISIALARARCGT